MRKLFILHMNGHLNDRFDCNPGHYRHLAHIMGRDAFLYGFKALISREDSGRLSISSYSGLYNRL